MKMPYHSVRPDANISPFFRNAAATLAAFSICLALTATSLAQEPLQFNVPYRCSDGTNSVITECHPITGGREICTWREEKNGQLVTEAYSIRTQMYGRLQGCPPDNAVKKAAAPPAAPSANNQQAAASGNLNPPYLKEFPSVERVMKEIQGSDANDTKLRQYGAFRWLRQMVQDTTGSRWFQNQLTPDERRIYGEYDVAFNRLGQPLDFPIGGYGTDHKFMNEIFTRFGMTEVRAQLIKLEAEAKARRDAANKPPASSGSGGDGGMLNDPGAVAVRRCLELGGTELHCLAKGLSAGFADLFGGGLLNAMKGPPITGLHMFGTYKASGGVVISFSEKNLSIQKCGKLIPLYVAYDAQRNGNQILVRIANQPQPILTGLGLDGRLVAPATADITGQIITGYTRTWVEQRYTADNTVVPGSGHWEQTPIYGAKTERCAIGTLLPGPPEPAISTQEGVLPLFADMFSMAASMVAGDSSSTKDLVTPGPRLAGIYAGPGGLKIEFRDPGAIIDCQQAHVAVLYDVSNTPGGLTVAVKNPASPFTLALQPNGTLVGGGTINVTGRLVAGKNDQGIVFKSVTASCSVGTLVAK